LTEKFDVVLTEKEKIIIRKILESLEIANSESNLDPEKIQQMIYETSKENEEQPRKIFKLMYKMLINANSGPRLGGYISDLGLNRIHSILDPYVS
jgi:lysyl-tRNA synthetase class 1